MLFALKALLVNKIIIFFCRIDSNIFVKPFVTIKFVFVINPTNLLHTLYTFPHIIHSLRENYFETRDLRPPKPHKRAR